MSKSNSTLTQEILKTRLHYDENSGEFTWVKSVRGVKTSDDVGYITQYGYRVVMLDKVNYFAHRLAWLYVYGSWPEKFIDHINCLKSDNRISNLREVDKSENGQNMKKARSGNKTGFLGVSKHGKNGWRAVIHLNGVATNIGTFRSPELAHAAYIEEKRKIHPMNTL